jgi:hypothetical protein
MAERELDKKQASTELLLLQHKPGNHGPMETKGPHASQMNGHIKEYENHQKNFNDVAAKHNRLQRGRKA